MVPLVKHIMAKSSGWGGCEHSVCREDSVNIENYIWTFKKLKKKLWHWPQDAGDGSGRYSVRGRETYLIRWRRRRKFSERGRGCRREWGLCGEHWGNTDWQQSNTSSANSSRSGRYTSQLWQTHSVNQGFPNYRGLSWYKKQTSKK